MKTLRLIAVFLAPLSMLFLGYLFLMPPIRPNPASPGVIAVVILDPVSRSIIDDFPDAIPTLAKLRGTGMCGTVLPGGALSMEETLCEILSGKDPGKLAEVPRMYNPNTNSFQTIEITDKQEGFLPDILNRYGRVTTRVMTSDENQSTNKTEIAAIKPDLLLFYIQNNNQSDSDYFKSINTILQEYTEIIGTWLVISPMHKSPVTWRFHINHWLLQNGYLTTNPDGSIDYSQTQAFYPGENESGVRVNRHLTYAIGSVPREDHENLMKELGKELRHLRIPMDDREIGGTLVFNGIFRGADHHTQRHEGWYPDIEWEMKNESIEIVADLLDDLSGSPWVTPEEGAEIQRPGGWMCLWGPPFDIIVDNEADLDMLLAADIAPTVLFLLNLPTAKDMQGRILQPLMVNSLQIQAPKVVNSFTFSDPFVEQ